MECYALIPVILLFLWSSTRSLLIECSRVVYLFLLSSWVCLKFSLDLSVSSDIFYRAGWVVIPSFHFLSWKVPLAPSVVTSSLLDTAFRFLTNKNKMECFHTVFSPFLNHHLPFCCPICGCVLRGICDLFLYLFFELLLDCLLLVKTIRAHSSCSLNSSLGLLLVLAHSWQLSHRCSYS